jgi:hypothetical protein
MTKHEKFLEKVMGRMFEAVGRVYSPEQTQKLDWFCSSTWTVGEEAKFRQFFIREVMRDFGFGKRKAKIEAGWFLLWYGWKIEQSDLTPEMSKKGIKRKEAYPRDQTISKRKWGLQLIEKLKRAEGGALTTAEVHDKYRITSATLRQRLASREIIFWRDRRGAFYYPIWQFDESGAVLRGISDLLHMFASDDQWRIVRYFLSKRSSLKRRRPLDLLRAGELGLLFKMTRGYIMDNNW